MRERLERAASGLVYVSEADHPFEFFSLPEGGPDDLSPPRFLSLIGTPPYTPVEERTLDEFFSGHIERSDPNDPVAQSNRKRYRRLKRLLRDTLGDVRVLRVGRVELRCYIVGVEPCGTLAGLVTTVVET